MYLKYNEQKVVDIESSDSHKSDSGVSSGKLSSDEEHFFENK